MSLCYVAFGSNVGDRLQYVLRALELLKRYGSVKKVSTIYVSQPWGKTDQPEFINGVLEFETGLNPIELLFALKEVEKSSGRRPRERWGPREIDLDILLYENHILMLSFLRVPHPHLLDRDFFLFPLLEINSELMHPLYQVPLIQFAQRLENRLEPFACLLPP
ncbi:MAG: 2-amino-4-hydroxy-6-hydroxymethyldihydropteridine diphosphokinase [Aquificaceae bacterium]|nr:2-amino-4-hydroxy-6-hydroxymethyldihydropteridine diphosphokinase [Aquificaceae bacterium]MCX8060686.1 2-amino-4-hydroxy-6-hydroxymethyldihydropteridine diphosphokinase [Aquificaceae bacterium]MDW8097621.1 2-amino-4-hydroxy-6-hydroxymethyldihydropteridine diphosphokinase [Aquificaceae bacterium]